MYPNLCASREILNNSCDSSIRILGTILVLDLLTVIQGKRRSLINENSRKESDMKDYCLFGKNKAMVSSGNFHRLSEGH